MPHYFQIVSSELGALDSARRRVLSRRI